MKPTTEERILAILSHLSALAFGSGMIIPAVLWSNQRQKSPYAAFQSLQAYGYQTLGYTVWMLAYLLVIILFFIVMLIISAIIPNAAQNQTITLALSIFLIVAAFGLLGIYFIIPVAGAVLCGMGKDFRYPILGDRLARSLGYQFDPDPDSPNASLDSAAEERFAAAMGHFAVILPLWGALAPLYFWLTPGQDSRYFKVQSAQTTIYQIFVNLFYFGMTFFSIFLGLVSMFVFSSFFDLGEWVSVAGMMVMLCALSIVLLILPFFHIIGQWAGLQVLRGKDYRYPLIGHWANSWFKKD